MNHRQTEHARTIRTEVLWSAHPVDDDGLPIVSFIKRFRGILGVLLLLLSFKLLSTIMATVAPMAMKREPQLVFADLEKPNIIEPITEVRLDGRLKRLADVNDRMRAGDIPLFFHIPRTMGGTYREILKCVGIEKTIGSTLDEIKNGKETRSMPHAVVTQYSMSFRWCGVIFGHCSH